MILNNLRHCQKRLSKLHSNSRANFANPKNWRREGKGKGGGGGGEGKGEERRGREEGKGIGERVKGEGRRGKEEGGIGYFPSASTLPSLKACSCLDSAFP